MEQNANAVITVNSRAILERTWAPFEDRQIVDNSSIHILACAHILAELCWQRMRELTAGRLDFVDSNSDHNKDSVHNGILALNEKYVDGATRTGYDLTKLARCIQDRRRDLK